MKNNSMPSSSKTGVNLFKSNPFKLLSKNIGETKEKSNSTV